MDKEWQANAYSQPMDGLPGTQQRRSKVGQQVLHTAMRRSWTPTSSHQRDRWPLLPGQQSSRASEHIIAKMAEDTVTDVLVTMQALHPSAGLPKAPPLRRRETLPGSTCARAETAHPPRLPPLAAKAARPAQAGLQASAAAAKTPGSACRSKLPAREASCRSSSRRRANALGTQGVARRNLESVSKRVERLATNPSQAAATAHFLPVRAAAMALHCGQSLEEEELLPPHLPLPALHKAKREARAPRRATQERARCLPEPRPASSGSALGKARMLREAGARTTLPAKSRQLSTRSCFVPGAQTIPQREMRGMPACKERGSTRLTEAKLPESLLGVAFSRSAQEVCQELVSKLLAAPPDACAHQLKAQCLHTMAHSQDLVLSKCSASQRRGHRPPQRQVPRAETRQGETASRAPDEGLQWERMPKGVSEDVQLTRPRFADVPPTSAKAIAASSHREMAPPESTSSSWPEPAGLLQSTLADMLMKMRAESQRPAPHSPALPAAALKAALLALLSAGALSRPDDTSPRRGQEFRAAVPQRTLARTIAPATLASAAQKQPREHGTSPAAAARPGPDAHAPDGKRKITGAGALAPLGRGHGPGTPLPAAALKDALVALVLAALSCLDDTSPRHGWPLAGGGRKQEPLHIVPRIRGKPLRVHPDNTSQYLAVLSIKTEPLEELNRSCLARTGQSLAQLREACLKGKEQSPQESEGHEQEAEGKRFSLTASGSLNVRPRELCARNSFYNLWQPELTRVELLKDASSKWEVLERLYAHAPERERKVRRAKRVLGAPQQEQADWSDEEEDAAEEPLQWQELEKNSALCMTWVRPSLRSLLADTQACHKEVPCSPGVKAADAATEAAGDLQSTPLTSAVPRGAEAVASPLARGFQAAGDSVPLAPSATTGTKAEATPTARDPLGAGENAPLPSLVPAEAAPEASHLPGGPWDESHSPPREQPLPKETKAEASALAAGPPHQA
ncbi:serine/arginine repetitive matrix protein 2-like isoform X2 [Struthio camelus]|uniref:serine/arginine repetitive matrix protein 2-like isoform X2 n=1 Tax=Struthio camelus TaxID=8801 RepID=UPI0036041C9B